MAVKKYKPITPGQRGRTGYTFEEITKTKPERSLLKPLRKKGGRNMYGRITVRHRGGGHRRHIRIVDFKRDKRDIPARVAAIEYDPNRTARLALLFYADGEKRYIVAPLDVRVGDTLLAGPGAEIRPGNSLPISNIPVGTMIHNIEMKEGRGGQLVRAAGGAAHWARPGASATKAFARPCEVQRCRLATILMAVVKAGSQLVCPVPRAPGVSPPWVIRPAVINKPRNILFAGAGRNAARICVVLAVGVYATICEPDGV